MPDYSAAEESQFVQIVKVIAEFIWTLILVNIEVIRSIIRLFVSAEPKDVTGEIVLITGSGHGIGRQVALRFARLGATVVSVDINTKGNEETVRMIREEKGKAHQYECDVTDRAACFALAEKVRKEVGEVTYLVNNAGIMPTKPITRQSEKDIRLMMDLNVNAYLWMLQAFLPSMMERNHGHIVSMASMAGIAGVENLVPYCGSKFAVRGIMDALSLELFTHEKDFSGIKLTTICPYMVNTGLCKKPRIRFSLMPMVEPEFVADNIVEAVRLEQEEITVPRYMHYLYGFAQLLPRKAQRLLTAFGDTGVDPEDE